MAENSNNNSGATAKKEGNSSSSIIQGKYELGRLLGHGTFAKVYHARNLQNGTSVAIKVVGKEKVMKAGMTKQVAFFGLVALTFCMVKREIAVMKMVRHPNIVELHEVMASKSKIYIVMELVRGGELFNKIIQGRLREDAARLYFQQLISAIDFCHSRGVYHRDLKLENLLLDDHGNLKVTDFGLSAISGSCSNQDGLLHTTCGTPAYVAPEVIGSNGYDGAKSDLWSCGVILYVLLAGYLPFKDESIISLYRKINRGDFRCPPWFSPDARRLVTGLLDPNPKKRFTVPKVTDLAWFKKTAPRQSNERRPPVTETPPAEIETLNAFHIISLSDGFDLSPLFEEKRQEEKAEMRFATTKPVSSVILGLEDVASRSGGRFNVVRKGETRVELMSREEGRKGRLEIAADIFAVAPSFLMVEVKKDKGDTLEYNQFCKDYLKPALKDILWNSIGDDSITEPI